MKKVSPDQLTQVVVDVLEELRLTLPKNNLEFTSAELEVSAKKSFEAGAELNVWVINAELDATKETNVTITYSLGKLLDKAKKESEMLAIAEMFSVNSSLKDNNLKSNAYKNMKSFPMDGKALPEFEAAQTFDQLAVSVDKVKGRRSKAKSLKNAKVILVESVQKSIQDYVSISKTFDDVSFDVTITFSVEVSGSGGIEIGFFGAEAGGGKGWEHSLKLSFGKRTPTAN